MPVPVFEIIIRRRGASGPAIAGSLFQAIRTKLLGWPGLSGVISEVYLRRPPPAGILVPPFMVYSPINGTFDFNTKDFYLNYVEIQFSVISPDDVQANALADTAFQALAPKNGSSPLAFSGGTDIYRQPLFNSRIIPQSDRQPNNKNWWNAAFGYRFWVSKTF